MKQLDHILFFMALLLTACTAPIQPSATLGTPCGDGICSGPENAVNCPADCATAPTNPETWNIPSTPENTGNAPLYLTTMTHMEQNFTDDKSQVVFQTHLDQLTYGMDLADQYGAILTIESEQPFARANSIWGRNFMAEIVARGHGVGTHCDFGFQSALMPVEQYAQFFSENKALVDALVGAENNLGCSGGGGANDWAQAAALAGFKYLDGIVGMHYLSMPLANRPDSTWTDEYIHTTGFHLSAPVDLYERIYPFGVADAMDFTADANPVIVVSSGELGLLSGVAENVGEIGGGQCRPNCTLTNADVDALAAKIMEISQNRDLSRVAKITIYIPANLFVAENEAVLHYFFQKTQELQQQGILTWASQKQVYEAYVNWNE
jgi:hypothetical protein